MRTDLSEALIPCHSRLGLPPFSRDSGEVFDTMNGLHLGDLEHNQSFENGFQLRYSGPSSDLVGIPFVDQGEELDGSQAAVLAAGAIDDYQSFSDSDSALGFINQILMEDDLEDQIYTPPGDPALVAAEKAFYDVLNNQWSSDDVSLPCSDSFETLYGANSGDFTSLNNEISSNEVVENSWVSEFAESHNSQLRNATVDYASPSSYTSFTNISNGIDMPNGFPLGKNGISDLYSESHPIYQFNKGMEDASKFLPLTDNGQLTFSLKSSDSLLSRNLTLDGAAAEAEEEWSTGSESRARKNRHGFDSDLAEGRSCKVSSVCCEEAMAKMFEDVLHLCIDPNGCGDGGAVGQSFRKEGKKNSKNSTSRKSNASKSRSKKQVKLEVIDLGTVLLQCAQSVATGDRRAVNEQLQLIRNHSSPTGDGSQRLAHYFADGLEARLAGMGSQIYQSRLAKRSATSADILKAYHLYMGISPFKRVSHFFANLSILNVANRTANIHVIDFGIGFGFQWPCLFRRLSLKKGGPPKLKITGIDLPQPGFRPRERLEETGRRLTDCAQSFGVPFEYSAIASKWENVRIEDLNIEEGEVLIVNCLYMLRNLADETVIVESPRSIVLNNIKRMNPDLFVTGVMSSAYGSPFFITRFREALFYYSALYDVLETNVPRDNPYRLLVEREFFGREAMNIIACEGSDRVYRPETYKQWRVRIERVGFKQLPFNQEIMKISRNTVTSCYDKNFIVEEDNNWMLLGWKGRVLYALSTWKPAHTVVRT